MSVEIKIERRSFVPDTSVLAEVRQFVFNSGRAAGLSDESIGALALAVDEAATNVIRHVANHHDCSIGCTCASDPVRGEVTYEISWEDDKPFHPQPPDEQMINIQVQSHTRGGLGIFLMHHLVDNITFDYHDGVCVVKLVKKL